MKNKDLAAGVGPTKEKEFDFNLEGSQLEGTTMAVAPVEHEAYRKVRNVTSFPTMEKFEPNSQDTMLDIGKGWSEIFEWPEWEDKETLNKENG